MPNRNDLVRRTKPWTLGFYKIRAVDCASGVISTGVCARMRSSPSTPGRLIKAADCRVKGLWCEIPAVVIQLA